MQPRLFLLPMAALCFAGSASAQAWSDDFESYALGSSLEGQGGWRAWAGPSTSFSTVSDTFARSGAQSVALYQGADTVHEYGPVSSGSWIYTGYIYLTGGWDGEFSYMIMNKFDDVLLAYEWGSWIQFQSATGSAVCNCGSSGLTVPLILDQWVQIRKEIDLDNDSAEIRQGGFDQAG